MSVFESVGVSVGVAPFCHFIAGTPDCDPQNWACAIMGSGTHTSGVGCVIKTTSDCPRDGGGRITVTPPLEAAVIKNVLPFAKSKR